MDDRISLGTSALVCGESPGTFRALISEYLPNLGVREGKERRINVWETAALRTVTEFTSSTITLKQAAQRVSGLLPVLRQIVEGKLGKKGYVYAVECWGLIGGAHKREGYIVEGQQDLGLCCAEATSLGWPNVRVLNLSHVLAEVAHGWSIAVNGPEMARALLENTLQGKTEGEQELARSIFAEMAARLDPLGDRRPKAPERTNWQMGGPSRPAHTAQRAA
jgi:hypothetical protein